MSCFLPEKEFSTPKKAWKYLISTLQKKLKYLKKSKPLNKTPQYLLNHRLSLVIDPNLHHHHHHQQLHCHYKHCHHSQSHQIQPTQTCVKVKYIDKLYAEPLRIEASHIEPDTEITDRRVLAKRVINTSSKGHNKEDMDDLEDFDDDDDKSENGGGVVSSSETTSLALQLHGVDAIAEEFIKKMRRSWTLERQKSDDDYIQRWTALYKY